MTLLKLFNNTLKELPNISKNLEHLIRKQGWEEKKSKQAIEIVRQLLCDCTTIVNVSYDSVYLSDLSITLYPRDCGIYNSPIFYEKNICQAIEYIENLLNDINHISEDIHFSLTSHNYCDSKECTFSISWEF